MDFGLCDADHGDLQEGEWNQRRTRLRRDGTIAAIYSSSSSLSITCLIPPFSHQSSGICAGVYFSNRHRWMDGRITGLATVSIGGKLVAFSRTRHRQRMNESL